jgi:hypothetical protein
MEMLPGFAQANNNESIFEFWFSHVLIKKPEEPITVYVIGVIAIIPTISVLFLSVIYRWALKSTSIIWSPLIWVIASARTIGPVRFRLYEICNVAMYKVMRLYSIVILLAFAWKMAVMFGWARLSAAVASSTIATLIMHYVAPSQLPLWQISAAVSALLAWGLYFLADVHLRAIEIGNPNRASETAIKRQIGAITVVRNTLALYTAACMLYITWQVAAGIEWPVVELVLFPWSW